MVRWFWRPGDLCCDAEQAIVVVVHPVEVEPNDRLGERLERRQVQELRPTKGLHAESPGDLPVVVLLIVAADIIEMLGPIEQPPSIYAESIASECNGRFA